MYLFIPAFIVISLGSTALSQTYSSCNPTENSSCPANPALSSETYSVDFTQGTAGNWTVTSGNVSYTVSGVEFTINESGESPTIESDFYIFFGSISLLMRAANGTGIVSSAIMESDDLDEIDWEWLGGSVNQVQTNYFGKGNATSYDRAEYLDLDDTQTTTHNYTILWASDATTWYVDGNLVRTLNYDEALSGKNYPQTPMKIKLGIWAGGDPENEEGTIVWAGGQTDYNQAPFTMIVERVEIINFNPATSYSYGDNTGDWTSIEVDKGATNSTNNTENSTLTNVSGGNGSETSSTTTSVRKVSSTSAVIAAESTSSGSIINNGIAIWLVAAALIGFR